MNSITKEERKVEDSKGKKISREELTEIYNNKQHEDFGNYLTYNGNDSQILEVVRRINFRRSPKVDLNYTRSYIDYLQQEAFKLAGDRKFARVVRMTFDPYFSAKDIQRNQQMSLREFLYDYSLSDMHNSDYAMWKGFEDKEFNDKVERFAQAYKIKIPESKNDIKEDFNKGGSLNSKLFSDYDFDEDGNPLGKTIASEIFLNKDKYKSLENKNLILSSNREYNFDREQSKGNKPRGLWYAKGFEWIDLLIENIGGIFPLAKYTRLYEIEVTDKVLKLIDEKDAIQFTKEYGVKTDFDKEYFDERYSEIDWKKVAKNYSGIELSTQLALNSHFTKRKRILQWTSGWDIGSGCIWDKSGIDKITLIMEEGNMEFKKGGKVAKAEIGSIEDGKYEGYFMVELIGENGTIVGKMDVQFTKPSKKFFYANPDDKYFEYARIGHSEIYESYRGSGYYVKMIKKAVEKAVELGFKGIVSLYDGEYEEERSRDANISWLTMSDPVYARNNGLKITPSEKNYEYADYYVELDPNSNEMKDDFKKGGKVTWKNKYNKKYGFDKDESHSLKDISKKSGVSMKGLQQIYNKGIGAYKTNPSSVRPNVTSKEQWAMGRVYSAVMGGKASKVDAKELKMDIGGKVEKIEEMKEIQTKGDMGDKVKFLKENPEIFMGKFFSKGGKLRTFLEVNKDIMKLNEQSRSGKLSHSTYYKAYEKLRKEFESIKRYNSVPQQMKRFGASVKKADGYRSFYYYIGKNFDGIIFEDCCERCWWQLYSIDIMKDKEDFEKQFGRKPRGSELVNFLTQDQDPYDTKKELVMSLYSYDQEFDDQEEFIKKYGDSWKDGKNFAKGGYITEGDKQSDYATLSNEDKLKYVKKEIGTINGFPIKRYYENFDRTSDEEFVVELDDPNGDHNISIDFRFKRDENDSIIGIDSLKFYRTIYEPIEYNNLYFASGEYQTDSDFNRAFEDLKEKGEYIFNTIEDFEKFMRLIQLERILYNRSNNLPLPIKKKLVVTKDTSYYDLPNFKNIMKQIKKRFSKVWRSNSDERFATRNDKYKMDYKPYILDTEIVEGTKISNIDYKDNMEYASIMLYYREQREPQIYASSFLVSGTAKYLANGEFYNLKIEIVDSSWFSKKKKKYQIKDYSDDQKELIAFLRKELKKTKKLK